MSAKPVSRVRFQMEGTEKTGEYVWIADSESGGIVGYRVLYGLEVRVRLEPSEQTVGQIDLPGWKQPEPTNRRFSTVVDLGQPAVDAIELALSTLAQITSPNDETIFNPDATQWREALNPTLNDEPAEQPELEVGDDPATEPTPAPKRRRLRLPTLLKRGRRRDTAAKQ